MQLKLKNILFSYVMVLMTISISAQDNVQVMINKTVGYFPNKTELAVGVFNKGSISYFGAQKSPEGVAEVDNEHTIFEIGSLTKVMTSQLLAQAIGEEKCAKDTKLSSILEIELNNGIDATLAELSNHTAGFARMPENSLSVGAANPLNPHAYYTDEMMIEYLTQYAYVTNQGTESQYSNLGAGILGYCLELLYNKPYEELLNSSIFDPLEMNATRCDLNSISGVKAIPLGPKGEQVKNWQFDALAAAGAVNSSVVDMTKYMTEILNGQNEAMLMQQETTFEINENFGMGLGWHVFKLPGDVKYLWHNGGTGGFHSQLLLDPEGQKGVVILSNVNVSNPNASKVEELVFNILRS